MCERKLEALNSLKKKKIHLSSIDKIKNDSLKNKQNMQVTDSPLINLDWQFPISGSEEG